VTVQVDYRREEKRKRSRTTDAFVYASLFLVSTYRDLEMVLRTDYICIARQVGEWDMHGSTCMRRMERRPVRGLEDREKRRGPEVSMGGSYVRGMGMGGLVVSVVSVGRVEKGWHMSYREREGQSVGSSACSTNS
jgi:hypothetical protein